MRVLPSAKLGSRAETASCLTPTTWAPGPATGGWGAAVP